MAQDTKKKPSILTWATWIAAGVCLILVITLAVMIMNQTPYQASQDLESTESPPKNLLIPALCTRY